MTELSHLKALVEQNASNIERMGEALNAQANMSDDVGGTSWSETLSLPHAEPEEPEGTSAEQLAALMEQNAKNIAVLAEAAGVPEFRIEGDASRADFSDVLGFGEE